MIVVTDDAARAACVSWERSLLGNTIRTEDVHPTALAAMRGALEAGLALLEDAGEPLDVAQHPTRTELSSRLDTILREMKSENPVSWGTINALDGIRAIIDGPAPLDPPRPADPRKGRPPAAPLPSANQTGAEAVAELTRDDLTAAGDALTERFDRLERLLHSQPEPAGVQEIVRRTGALTTRIERLIDHQIESGQRIGAILGPVMGETPDDTVAGLIDGAKVEARKSAARLERMLLDLVGMLTGDHKGSFGRRLDNLEDANEAAGAVELAGFEPDPAYNWDSALTMAASQRDRRNWDPARLRREARWFYAELLAGPDDQGCPECHRGPDQPHDEGCGRYEPDSPATDDPRYDQPHHYAADPGHNGGCWMPGCGKAAGAPVHLDPRVEAPRTGQAVIPSPAGPHPYQGESGMACDICGNSPIAALHNDVSQMGKSGPADEPATWRPHIFTGQPGNTPACAVEGCGLPLMDDVHKAPGNGGALKMPGTGFIAGGHVGGGSELYAMQPGERIAFRDTTPPNPDDDLPSHLVC